MTGVNEAAQLINVSINGVSTALRLSGSFINWSIHEIADLARIITALVRKKSEDLKPGEWNWGDLIRKCGKEEIELTTFDVDLSIKEEIIEHLKEMKIPFSILPDINVEDGKFQISLPKSYDEAIIAFGSRFNTPGNPFTGEKGHIAVARTTLEGYMKTADPEKIREFLREVMEDPEMEQAMQFQKDKEAVASPDVARYFTDLHQDAEVLVVNDAGEGYDTPSVRSSAMDTLKVEGIDFLILPRDKDGRSCFLVDTKRREDISKTFPQGLIQYADYLHNAGEELSDELKENLKKLNISSSVKEEEEYVEVKVPKEGRVFQGVADVYQIKVLDDTGDEPEEAFVNIKKGDIHPNPDDSSTVLIRLSQEQRLFAYHGESLDKRRQITAESFVHYCEIFDKELVKVEGKVFARETEKVKEGLDEAVRTLGKGRA